AGVITVLLPLPTMAAFLTWLTVAVSFRYVSLASLAAAVALCLMRFATTAEPLAGAHLTLTLFCFLAAFLVFVRHWSNLVRLLRATKNQLRALPAMFNFSKILHVLAVGLWFGSAVFFSFVVGFSLFGTFEAEARKEGVDRPSWFPRAPQFDKQEDKELRYVPRKDQGTRAAGTAISPMFLSFFLLQGLCGFVAAITALKWSWAEPANRIHRVRATLLLLALGTVIVGWPLEQKVSDLRIERNAAADKILDKYASLADA